MTKELISNGGNCLASAALLEGKQPLLWAFREKSLMPSDSGWRFFAATDTQTEIMDGKSILLVDINKIAELEPIVASIYWYPEGADFQLASKDGNKYFVYNDTFERVLPAVNAKDLPFETKAFQNHFELLAVQEEAKGFEHEVLQMSAEQVDMLKLLDLMHVQDTDQLSTTEIFMNAGLLLGFVGARNQAFHIDLNQNQVQDIARTMMDYFNLDVETATAYVHHYLTIKHDGRAIAEQQLLMYGNKMYEWVLEDNFLAIKNEYANLLMHHRKANML
ncbi:DUF2185 domain-containing protein [Aerococcus agrisoli]|uniref:DUF2185 domain-containing protein n=1 Tax=Aerococcus agrisoli TaxID=2487350 RepID=A0A3N4G7A0_9LACT|nr:DUF2185 domain-containing protein [Aerococcus agrisoli]RPA56406.1 DUF2185 domain-containing protein [Aerococcus agrisoli]